MNSFVFNSVASELKTSIYAQSPDTSLKSLQLDSGDRLLIGGNVSIENTSITVSGTINVGSIANPVSVSSIINPIMIGNSLLTMSGTVTVSTISNPVTIGNASLTVNGNISVNDVVNPITVNSITNPVTIGNSTITTIIAGSTFTSDSVTDLEITGTGTLFDDKDISIIKTASMFIYNEGTNTVTLSLQMSPTTVDSNYIDDPTYTDFTIAGGANKIVTIGLFANYTRLEYDMGDVTGTITAFYNAQT